MFKDGGLFFCQSTRFCRDDEPGSDLTFTGPSSVSFHALNTIFRSCQCLYFNASTFKDTCPGATKSNQHAARDVPAANVRTHSTASLPPEATAASMVRAKLRRWLSRRMNIFRPGAGPDSARHWSRAPLPGCSGRGLPGTHRRAAVKGQGGYSAGGTSFLLRSAKGCTKLA